MNDKICECSTCTEERDAAAAKRGALYAFAVGLGLFLGALALTFIGCGPVPGPKPPQTPRWALDVTTEPGAAVRILDGPNALTRGQADAVGHVRFPSLVQSGFTVCALAVGFHEHCTGVTLTSSQATSIPLTLVVPVPAVVKGQLRTIGRQMVYPDGSRFPYRGVMAFALLDLIADGKTAEAEAFMSWAQKERFSVLRVLAMNYGWMELSPEDGRRALPELLQMAADHELYVQIVALAGTGKEGAGWGSRDFLKAQVTAAGAACAAVDNCIAEIANEFYHGSQAAPVHDLAFLRELRTLIPSKVMTALGAPKVDEGPDAAAVGQGADFIVLHLDRSRDRWNRTRRVRELELVSSKANRFVVDNEPMGADEVEIRGKRDNQPAVFFAQGVLSRVFGVGSTLHCTDCLNAKVPRPAQQACAKAFIDGATLWPDDWTFTFANTGRAPSPIKTANFTKVARVYSAGHVGRWWVVPVGLTGDPAIVYVAPWTHGPMLADKGGVQVFEAVR